MFITDKIEVLVNGIIQVREKEVLELVDGTTVDGKFHRYVVTPNIDINTIICPKVNDIATVSFTPEVIQAYNNMLDTEL